MNRTLLSLLLLNLCLTTLSLTVTNGKVHARAAEKPHLRGYSIVIPYPGSHGAAMAASIKKATIPLASLSVIASKDGNRYTDIIVGSHPGYARIPTHVKILVVPMVVDIGSNVFDSTAPNSCGGSLGHTDLANFLGSPVITPVTFDGVATPGHAAKVNGVNMGKGTYVDTHRRAEFLRAIGASASPYHTLYDVTVAATQTITAATSAGHSAILAPAGTGCRLLGGLEFNFFDGYFVNTVLKAVHADPTYFVIFLMRDIVFYDTTTDQCCILGYHGALGNMQTYSPIDYDTTGDFGPGVVNVSIAAHEVAEWIDDPLGNNPTPPWGGLGQVPGCQANFEAGDPLTGTNFPAIKMPNGVIYNPQETPFWSWFYAKDHDPWFQNIAAGGKFSMNGTFGGPSKACPPGGTFPN